LSDCGVSDEDVLREYAFNYKGSQGDYGSLQ
jgi:hypothetical protein